LKSRPKTLEENKIIADGSERLWLGGEEPWNKWWDLALQWNIEDGGEAGFVGEVVFFPSNGFDKFD
jgi:hypothetical protein